MHWGINWKYKKPTQITEEKYIHDIYIYIYIYSYLSCEDL